MSTIPKFVAAIERELKSHGIERWSIHHGGKHPRLAVDGIGGAFVFAGTSGDERAILNMLTNLRRWLGVKKIVHKNPANRGKVCRPRVDRTVVRIHEIAADRQIDRRKTLSEMLLEFQSKYLANQPETIP